MSEQATLNFTDMTSDERLVWHALSACEGKSHAVTQYELAAHCRMEPDAVRKIITSLIFLHRKPIGSSPSKIGGGYYIIIDPVEAEEVSARLKKQAVKILQKAAVIMQISEQELFMEMQMEMELGE